MSRYRLWPTTTQHAALLEHCAHARFVWNLAVEQHSNWERHRNAAPGYLEQCRQLSDARAAFDWLGRGSVIVQQQALRDFAHAMTLYFAGVNRRPTWRKRDRNEGFRIVAVKPAHVRRLSRRWGEVLIPKIGWVRFRWTRAVPTDIRSFRVTRDRAGRWHIGFAVVPPAVDGPNRGDVVGVDRGVKQAVTLSTGEGSSPRTLTLGERSRLVRLQRRHARTQPGSNRRARITVAIARLKAREADRRKDWVEKTTTDIARRFDVIRVEDLRIRAMTRSARGSLEQPGKNVRAKTALNRGILSAGWGLLVTRLEQKAPGRVEKVIPAFTSQTCSVCGHCATENRESQAIFGCTACGYRANADINAAQNIAAGRAVTARRGMHSVPMKREPRAAAV